jgi:hypothetical protein
MDFTQRAFLPLSLSRFNDKETNNYPVRVAEAAATVA